MKSAAGGRARVGSDEFRFNLFLIKFNDDKKYNLK